MVRLLDGKMESLRVLLLSILLLSILQLTTGCGGEEKVEGSPDKAILAYAEIFMKGETENLAAAGFSEEYAENIRGQMAEAFSESFKDVAPLNAASLNQVAKKFYTHFKDDIKFKATLKQADAKNPVVELTTTPPDQIGANRAAVNNDELIALIGMVGQLKADGATDEQLADNPDVQKLAVTALEKYIDNIPLQAEKSLDVTCEAVKGSDGKTLWVPQDLKVFKNFIRGQS
ncbi:hypothetical protein IJI17_01070 [Candidatus Saccharibacteria bacterium]|nr:hypothetical protein [Candidatus Saccharibacteria bacterium]MBR0060896.1 hypothetical protein [Selenomonadaceae bacterium]